MRRFRNRRRRLFGARDRFGIKPLYYSEAGGDISFASEMKTLLQSPGFRREVDRQSAFHYLTLGFVPGGRSILIGIHRLPPAHAFTYDIDKRSLKIEPYWEPVLDPPDGLSEEEAVAVVRDTLGTAVDRWSLSDVPIACSLSGPNFWAA
jgi:asparagine synthase (glutamine-hydrolysing)